MRPVSEILADALASLEDGKRWLQGQWYSDHKYDPEHAQKFCSLGAIKRSMIMAGEFERNGRVAHTVKFRRVSSALAPTRKGIATLNDSAKSFDEVRQMFCAGIKKALEEENLSHEGN